MAHYDAAATAAVALGLALLGFEYRGNWIIIKIILVLALLAYHAYCGVLLSRFAAGKNRTALFFYACSMKFRRCIVVNCRPCGFQTFLISVWHLYNAVYYAVFYAAWSFGRRVLPMFFFFLLSMYLQRANSSAIVLSVLVIFLLIATVLFVHSTSRRMVNPQSMKFLPDMKPKNSCGFSNIYLL